MIQEPLPLLDDDDADPTLRRLLGSARADAPSATALRAAPAAIATLLAGHTGLAAGAAGATGGLAAASSGSSAVVLSLGKWFGIGALLGTASVATITATTTRFEVPAASGAAQPALPAPVASARVAARAVEAAAPVTPSSAPTPEIRSNAPKADLALEVRLLDQARAALRAGEPERALRVLTRLDALPSRMLVPEALVLRVRALIAARRVAEARRVGEEFLRRAPSSPQAGALRSVLAEIEAP